MTDPAFDTLKRLRFPLLLVSNEGLIVFASDAAQRLLLGIEIVSMPISCFVFDWERIRPVRRDPAIVDAEIFGRDGEYLAVKAVVFQLRSGGRWLSGLAIGNVDEPVQAIR
ncbi:hypothetical protein E0H35_35195 [Rhizobium leguminosarum bv. viciae]|uniref:hypothetical protein n=1 Tax=Rhizobium leguminosarum TaxID=384 RepID=UPI00103C09EE|nr:hypothetical protein [Rhizobium leguminosarum]MBY5345664.1 hypothetical protein [Rhizobium leguminosarum]NKK49859.1 hypothetical protein [Rhizobium leguminosarum bv. viciae]TBY87502.1 hypothetical protein E0H35_35195 [Rhizobium leguminosarum bv. viciae]